MSVQKLIAEADKLLEKSKVPEAIAKLKSAISEDPLNQLAANKLAGVHSDLGDKAAASKVLINLASRLSDAGKAQVAIAIYKQAIELNPNDIDLKMKYAYECEQVGKLGDAHSNGYQALQHFLKRKKHFDAANLMPLLVRTFSKDESMKQAWIEIMQLSQAEAKLIHLLVCLCGPPGLVSEEFSVGGDPVNLSDKLYNSLKGLVAWFPRDPKIAYAVAWAAQRKGKMSDFYHYLRESIRREPDFCLSLLLLARTLAEQQKLNESLFVYHQLKNRFNADKSVDLPTLNRLIENFVEKNGWISFSDDSGEEISVNSFLNGIKGIKSDSKENAPNNRPGSKKFDPDKGFLESITETLAPAEIDINSNKSDFSVEGGVEIQLTGGKTKTIEVSALREEAKASAPPPPPAPPAAQELPPLFKTPPRREEAAPSLFSFPKKAEQKIQPAEEINLPEFQTDEDNSIMHTSLVSVDKVVKKDVEKIETPVLTGKEKKLFNPLASSSVQNNSDGSDQSVIEESGEKTQMFSPMDILQVSSRNVPTAKEVNTKSIETKPESALESSGGSEGMSTNYSVADIPAEGEPTMQFSPADAILATAESRKPFTESVDEFLKTTLINVSHQASAPVAQPKEVVENSLVFEDKTEMFIKPPPDAAPLAIPSVLSPSQDELTIVAPRRDLEQNQDHTMMVSSKGSEGPKDQTIISARIPMPSLPEVNPQDNLGNLSIEGADQATRIEMQGSFVLPQTFQPSLPIQPALDFPESKDAPSPPGVAVVPLPDLELNAQNQSASLDSEPSEQIDMGDDLLESPTRFLNPVEFSENTEHLLSEINRTLDKGTSKVGVDSELLLRKAERYTAKRNYYLARKALRHARALGAAEDFVKEKLREIRKLEFPDGLYAKISSDETKIENAEDLIEKLEREFDLKDSQEESGQSFMAASVHEKMEDLLKNNDPKTILDFGVGLYEMGMFKEAENLFTSLVEYYPEVAFDAFYLSAISKFARKDYAGSASILKRLSNEIGKTEQEKISIYYALGEVFEKLRQTKKSAAFYKKVAEIDSNYRNIKEKLSE